MTIEHALLETRSRLEPIVENPVLEARILVGDVCNYDTTQLFLHTDSQLTPQQLTTLHSYIDKRLHHIPIAYILGEKEFYGKSFLVTPQVLVPRPDTECMIEWIQQHYQSIDSILDIGTGSGCIAITLASLYPSATIIGTDISDTALSIAKKNATLILGEEHSITWCHSDLLDEVQCTTTPTVITANLPYLDQNRYTDDSIRHEPDIALYSSHQGLYHYTKLFDYLSRHLFFIPETMIIEINPEQVAELISIASQSLPAHTYRLIQDYAGQDRHIIFQWKNE